MKKIRLGTIGSGFIVRLILDNVMRTEEIELEAVYSRSREKGEQLAACYECGKVYTDMDAFLEDESIDLVYIATPNLFHYGQAKKALLAGKHVLLEKPFTTKAEQAEELADIAREKGLLLLEAAPTSFLPNFAILKEELKKIGKVKLAMSNYSQYSSRYDAVLLFIKIAHDPIDVNPFCHGFAAEAHLPAAGIPAALPSGSRQIFKIALLNFLQNPV